MIGIGAVASVLRLITGTLLISDKPRLSATARNSYPIQVISTMANYVYLCCTDFPDVPAESQFDDFFNNSGTEYEAKWTIPLFWLCLFSSEDIRIFPAGHEGFDIDNEGDGEESDDDDSDDDTRRYAYLFCSRAAGIERLKRRGAMLEKVLGVERYALYGEWIIRLEAEAFQNILVRTDDLDGMGEEGELEQQLREACTELEGSRQQEGFRVTEAIGRIAGMQEDQVLAECESYLLVGSANGAQRWPPTLNTAPVVSSTAVLPPPKKKSPWCFWR